VKPIGILDCPDILIEESETDEEVSEERKDSGEWVKINPIDN
jgi:hypothetical protein